MQVLELDELPRDGEKLQALLNQKRYEGKRARRRVYVALGLLLALCLAYYLLGPGVVAWIAAIVFVVSSARLLLRRRSAPTNTEN